MVKVIGALLPFAAVAQDLFLSLRNESSPLTTSKGDCNSFKKNSDNCKTGWSPTGGCGQCMNPGGRAGVRCKGAKQTGYYCPVEDPPAGADMAFACMDWTFGSNGMKSAQAAFQKRTGENVHFGVGSYGVTGDAMQGLAACYRVKASGVSKELILQSINSGHDVSGGQFDVQVGNGGAGKFNTCHGGSTPGHNTMYSGSSSSWGKQYGGADHKSQCKGLPKYPANGGAMQAAGDDLVSLCEYSFDQKLRGEGGGNPKITSIGRVRCPKELLHMTQVRRKDEPSSYAVQEFISLKEELSADANSTTGCQNCLTRMMDCRKPTAGIKDNIRPEMMVDGHKIVQTCTSDGYTRLDVQCGCFDCYC